MSDDFGTDGANPHVPDILPVLSVGQVTVFPMALAPLAVSDERAMRLVSDAMRGSRTVAVLARRNDGSGPYGPSDLFDIGSAVLIQQMMRVPDGTMRMVVQGFARIRVTDWVSVDPYLVARIVASPEPAPEGIEAEALVRTVKDLVGRVATLTPEMPEEVGQIAETLRDPYQVMYFAASVISLPPAVRQEILEIDDPIAKLQRVVGLLQHEVEVRDIGRRIRDETKEKMAKSQKEYILREQLRTIRHELGEEDGPSIEIRDLRERVGRTPLSEEARREAERELSRLERINEGSPEYGVARTWLDWILALPWGRTTGRDPAIAGAAKVLDEDHYDLEKVKERILEYLAVRGLRNTRGLSAEAPREPILCFVGPPGVGKTSLGQSIARATGRRFARISLGGVHDEAEIRGHRRTYIGAMPGRIIQSLRKAEASDPVFMLDEVDKLGRGVHGDPSSALLEVLDPAQNHTFADNYLGVAFDLTRVLFICTANTTETIPPPVLDRMEVIHLPGYTEEEKLFIARRYLLPKQREAAGLTEAEAAITDDGLRVIVRGYTREAGVRNLDREIANCLRKVARGVAEGRMGGEPIGAAEIETLLGPPRHFSEVAERIDRPGVATGLAWTPTGGEMLFVEAALIPGGTGRLTLTGQLGDVMKESVQAALTCVKTRAAALGLPPFSDKDIHVHVPAGAVPKDGPSAGVTMAAALASVVTDRPVRSDLAMTGEITLRGKVLPVGGIKEKVLAAHRAGIRRVLLPRRNEIDLRDLPQDLRAEMEFVPLDNVEQLLDQALAPVS